MSVRPVLRVVVLAALLPLGGALPHASAAGEARDLPATTRLLSAANTDRAGAGLESLYERTSYDTSATAMAIAAMNATTVVGPSDGAPSSYTDGVTPTDVFDQVVDTAIDNVVSQMHSVLAYALHTDAGVAVVRETIASGLERYGVALIVGWPGPALSADSGCSANGYCWSQRGLNPHLPWTRNRVKVWLSTSGMPTAGPTLLKSAIAKLNAVSGFGADLAYGGTTGDTGPTAAHRFVVRWGSGCASTALACTSTTTQGTYHLIFQAITVVSASRYRANPSTTWWTGTLMHELAHAVGLGHYNATYGGTYQLMRWAGGPDAIQHGDANGLRAVNPGGALAVSVRGRLNGATYDVIVRASSTGLGGIRAIRTDCLDSAGVWRTLARIAGAWDSRAHDYAVGHVAGGRTCRAVVKSKTRTVYSASTPI